MFNDVYGFADNPFALLPDPRFFYGSRAHRRAMAYLRFGLRQGEGFIVVTGPVGTGKSMLAARLLAEIDGGAIAPVHVATSQIGPAGILRLIAAGLGVDAAGSGKDDTLLAIEASLRAWAEEGRRVLVVVDEAQNLPFGTLEELRMLSNLAHCGLPLAQCFLLGQPQLARRLRDPALEQLRQRVAASCAIEPLSAKETQGYIEHRLQTAGWRGNPAFAPEALLRVHAASGGVPRRINAICSRILFFCALEHLDRVGAEAVESVLRDLALEDETAAGTEAALAAAALPEDPAPLRALIHAQARAIRELAAALAAATGADPAKVVAAAETAAPVLAAHPPEGAGGGEDAVAPDEGLPDGGPRRTRLRSVDR